MVDAVTVYVDYCQGLMTPGAKVMIEHRFDLSPLNPPDPMFGTGDFTAWWPKERHLHIADYKHGSGVNVVVEENDQLMMYALGAVVELGVKPDLITVAIVQPRTAGEGEDGVKVWTFTYDDLKAWKRRAWKAAKKAVAMADGDMMPELKVGSWCRFCKAQGVCPAQKTLAVETAQTDFAAMDGHDVFPSVLTLTREELGDALAKFHFIEEWMAAARAHAIGLLNKGEEIPGFKMVPKRAMRKWKDSDDEIIEQLQKLGLPEEDLYTKKLVSPAQAEKVIKALFPAGARPTVEELVTRVSSGSNLVPVEDPRPAITSVSAADDFDVPNSKTVKKPKRKADK